jgi:aconitate hydratase 2/2-methylisocitrate dehydratase
VQSKLSARSAENPPKGEESTLVDLLTHRVPAGVDDAAKSHVSTSCRVAHGTEKMRIDHARESVGVINHAGGYNIARWLICYDAEVARGRRVSRHAADVRSVP